MKYLYLFNILLLKRSNGKIELSLFNRAAACVITADDFVPFVTTDTEKSTEAQWPTGALSLGKSFSCSPHSRSPLVLCLGLRPPAATSTCLPFSSVLSSWLGSRVDETTTVYRCSFWQDQERHSHNKLPVLLQFFCPPLPKRLLSLGWGGRAVDVSVGTYPVPMVSIDVQVTSCQRSSCVNNVFRNTHTHHTRTTVKEKETMNVKETMEV